MSALPHTIKDRARPVVQRWVAFNAVGLAGMLVQLAVVAFLVRAAGWHVLVATAIGVESAVLHNFMWHQRWTWRDRPTESCRSTVIRLVHFQLLNGLVSLAGNLALTAFFTGVLKLEAVVANAIAIATCSLVNFGVSESIVFQPTGRRRWIWRPSSF